MKRWKLAAFSLLLAVCGQQQSFAGKPLTLGSGKTVQMISVDTVKPPGGGMALMLKYRTALALTDTVALRYEADDIWNSFAPYAEKSQYDHAVIMAIESGGQDENSSHSTGFNKWDGHWQVEDFKTGETPKVTTQIASAVMGRLDAAYQNKEAISFSLYLSKTYTAAIDQNGRPPQVQDAAGFLSSLTATFHNMPVFTHTRQIKKVVVSDNGEAAEVTSEETTTGTSLDGRSITAIEHSVDHIGVEHGSLVLTRSSVDGSVDIK